MFMREAAKARNTDTVCWRLKSGWYWPDTLNDRNTLRLHSVSTTPCADPDEIVARMANSGLWTMLS